MKIVINALSARLGGGQTYLKNLLAHLPEQADLEVLVFASAALHLPQDRRLQRRTTFWPTENPILRTVWEKLALPRILARERADVLFCPGGVIATRVPTGCKTVTMFRNMIPFDRDALARIPFGVQKIRNLILRMVMLSSMANADLTIFISEFARETIERLTPIPNPVTIPHGISEVFRTAGQEMARPSWLFEGEYLLYVSRFDVYKHQLEVAQAYAALSAELRARYKLLLVGEADNSLAQQVLEFAKSKGLVEQIQIIGAVPYAELPAVYHHATVNLFASSCENCPNILLEALGAGRPVLSSNVMPMPEFGADAVGYFSPTNTVSISVAMVRVLRDESYRNLLGATAAKHSANYDWRATSDATWKSITGLFFK